MWGQRSLCFATIVGTNLLAKIYQLHSLGTEGVLPGRHIVRVFKQFTHLIPSGQMLSSFKTCSPL
jgi:hypothetical protein